MTTFSPPLSLFGHFACGDGLHLSASCCDRTFITSTSSCEVNIFIPSLPTPWQDALLTPPTQVAPKDESDIGDEREKTLNWGLVTEWTDYKGRTIPTTVRVSRLGFQVSEVISDSGELKDTRALVLSEIETWWAVFCSWVAVLTEQDPNANSGIVGATHQEPIWTWVDGAQKRRAQQVSTTWRSPSQPPNPIDRPTLMACMNLAGKGEPPPDEWIFIRDARSAVSSGDYRRAVIDAGTAAELAIIELLDQRLVLEDPTLQETIMKRARALEGSSSIMKELQAGTEPTDFTRALKNPRNSAAHKGHRPSKEVAQKAIAVAVELVEQATPLLSLIPQD